MVQACVADRGFHSATDHGKIAFKHAEQIVAFTYHMVTLMLFFFDACFVDWLLILLSHL